MGELKKANLLYLFIKDQPSNKELQKKNYEILKEKVKKRFSFSKDYPFENVIQIILNGNYGIREMLSEKRSFNYLAYFLNGNLFFKY